MKKLTLAVLAIFAFTLNSCQVEPVGDENLSSVDAKSKVAKNSSSVTFDYSQDCAKSEAILYAGQTMEVGKLTVTEEGGNYIITYEITNSDWCITSTHLSVVNTPEDFPMTPSGNPKNGNFEYNDSYDCVKTVTYEVPTSKGPYIAAHADVECVTNSEENIVSSFPEALSFCTSETFRPNDGERYFDINIEGGLFQGSYAAWCVDLDNGLGNPECIEDVLTYSSMGSLPEGAFEQEDNFGGINWLLNENIVNQPYNEEENFTGDDFQMAIWLLVDDLFDLEALADLGNVENWSADRVNSLVTMAKNHNDFVPECGDYIGVIINPVNRQKLIFAYLLECSSCEETAWADGCDFPGGNWATYFQFNN